MPQQPTARRCSLCGLSWPSIYTYYANCPQCGQATQSIDGVPMSEEEAASLLNHINFQRHLEGESLLPAPKPEPTAKEPASDTSTQRREKFDSVIAGAGYTKDELQVIAVLEGQLGMRRNLSE